MARPSRPALWALWLALAAACGSSSTGTDTAGTSGTIPLDPGSTTPGGNPTPSPSPTPSPAPSPSPGPAPAPADACSNPIRASAAPAAQVLALGTYTVGAPVSFTVPPGTVSVTIVEQAVSAPATITYTPSGHAAVTLDNTAVPLRLVAPGNVRVFDDTAAPPADLSTASAVYLSEAPGTGTLTLPNTSAGLSLLGASGLAPGAWTVTVGDWAYECTFPQAGGATCAGGSTASTYDVTVLLKGGTTVPSAGTVDLAIYFATATAGSTPLTAATAGADADLQRMIRTVRALLGNAGLALGAITYTDLPADVQATYATGISVDSTGTCSALASLLRRSAAGNTLNVFFVSSLTSTTDSTTAHVVGVDGSIPGPSSFGGTDKSGVAATVEDLRSRTRGCNYASTQLQLAACGADVTGYIVAHEAGHFLGLYHVTESDGQTFDPLSDTPSCPCRTCASSCTSAQMTVAQCTASASCGGGDNLMFWLLDQQGSTGALTPEQGRIMRANPLVR